MSKAKERSTRFVATVMLEPDSEWDDVESIIETIEDAGYNTRMSSDNSQVLVTKEEQ